MYASEVRPVARNATSEDLEVAAGLRSDVSRFQVEAC
jgi:hypothetical protein